MLRVGMAMLMLGACGRSGFDSLSAGDSGPPVDDGGSLIDDAALLGDGALDPDAQQQALAFEVSYTAFNGTTPPPARRSSGAALQAAPTELIWAYGGYNGAYLSDLIAWDNVANAWITAVPSGTPPGARERHALAFAPGESTVVLFGGQFRPMITFVHYDELWLYATATNSWAQVPKAGAWPAQRKDAALVYVPHLGTLLLYGGNDGANANNRYDDLWMLSLASSTAASWQLLAPGGVTPPKQSAGCVAYDPTGHRLIVYGGETADGIDNNATYQYLLDTNVWQADATTGTPPIGQSFQQCFWDPTISRVVVYGGQNTGGNPLGGGYLYDPDSKAWTQPTELTANVGARADGAAVWSPVSSAVLWFGGRTATTTYTNQVVKMDVEAQ